MKQAKNIEEFVKGLADGIGMGYCVGFACES